MTRQAEIPESLRSRPFTLEVGREVGLSHRRLAGAQWKRLLPRLYSWIDADSDPLLLLQAVITDLPSDAAFSGPTAAWLDGLEIPPFPPVDVSLPPGSAVSGRVGLKVHRVRIDANDIVRKRGVQATSTVRTIADLARQLPLAEAVALADAALHRELLTTAELTNFIARSARTPGVARLRRVAELVDGRAESPMETVLRVLLLRAGLPRPELQVDLHDSNGRFVARADLYYPEHRLVIEFDGGTHRDSMVTDDRRQNLILAAGFRLLRFTSADVYAHPASVVAQVRAALRPRSADFRKRNLIRTA